MTHFELIKNYSSFTLRNRSIMKKIILSLFIGMTIITSSFAQDTETASSTDGAIFEFEKETIDYGRIEKGSEGKRVFKFKNVGNEPLMIDRIKSSCGCTVPKAPEDPIMPGETGEIAVTYDTKRVGGFNKQITITSNATEPMKKIKIKGIVLKESANSSMVAKPKNILESN